MKRFFDVFIALIALIVLSVPMALIALLVQRKIGNPIFFTQLRPGLKGKPFRMVKFRTMSNSYDSIGQPLPDAQRLSQFGRFLRSTSLDELPELWNVLKGDMSLVGPRPLLMEYMHRYSPAQARRHEVKPGVTGWAQINGRNAISWEEKFQLDLWYVDNHNLYLDLKILLATFASLTKRGDVNASKDITMPEFMGDQGE